MTNRIYRVYDKSTDLWWSNNQGWVWSGDATYFTHIEMQTLDLPMGGEWKFLGVL